MSTGHTEDITLNEKILSQCLCNQITTTYTLNPFILCQLHLNKVEIKKKKLMKYIFKKADRSVNVEHQRVGLKVFLWGPIILPSPLHLPSPNPFRYYRGSADYILINAISAETLHRFFFFLLSLP